MKRTLSVTLTVTLVMMAVPVATQEVPVAPPPSRGPLTRSAMREAAAAALVPPQTAAPAAALKQAAEGIPIGKDVRVTMLSGKSIKGKLRAADGTGVRIEYWDHTGPSELQTTVVRYDAMQSIERDHLGTGTNVAIIVGIAVAVLAVLAGSLPYFQS